MPSCTLYPESGLYSETLGNEYRRSSPFPTAIVTTSARTQLDIANLAPNDRGLGPSGPPLTNVRLGLLEI